MVVLRQQLTVVNRWRRGVYVGARAMLDRVLELVNVVASCYGTRSPVHEHTPRIKTILKVPNGAWSCWTSEVAWELFRSRNPYLTAPCAIGNF